MSCTPGMFRCASTPRAKRLRPCKTAKIPTRIHGHHEGSEEAAQDLSQASNSEISTGILPLISPVDVTIAELRRGAGRGCVCSCLLVGCRTGVSANRTAPAKGPLGGGGSPPPPSGALFFSLSRYFRYPCTAGWRAPGLVILMATARCCAFRAFPQYCCFSDSPPPPRVPARSAFR